MKKRMIAGVFGFMLLASTLFFLSDRGVSAQAADLMSGVKANTVNTAVVDLTGDDSGAIANFAVKLLQNSAVPEENTLVSPLSVLCALAMTANGAEGATLAQMEDAFGLHVPELNDYLHTYLQNLPSGDKYKVSVADSIWFRDDKNLTVKKDFLQTNADYYSASIYKAAFDETTLKDINAWVSDNTDGMIENILDEIPNGAIMYLINALAFDAEWANIYSEDQVRDGAFTTESGATRDVEMMYSSEHRYLEDGNATGFVKYYADRRYAFAALLPNEGVSVADYIASLTGDGLMSTLNNAQNVAVETAIPKFESEYAVEMNDILKAMGITDAFDADSADFTGIVESAGNIFISRVLHKTHIAVDEKGTKAGAATAVEMKLTGALLDKPPTVHLDRPFVYLLIDCDTNLPIFIGTVTDL
ncbi:serpin family protein [Desulfoscipio sp. XC116]|uniref:serpin family protein n=1 Tax=Desulfoscipio sp. XC116 TaxID=3144975 RepID=UPI00325B7426